MNSTWFLSVIASFCTSALLCMLIAVQYPIILSKYSRTLLRRPFGDRWPYYILRFNFEKMFNIFIKIIIPGLTRTKKIWVKIVFLHLLAKIWENHTTISCSFAFSLSQPAFLLLLIKWVPLTFSPPRSLSNDSSFPYRISSRFVL